MKTFQTLKVFVPEGDTDDFLTRLRREIDLSKWELRDDLALNYKKNTFTQNTRVLCVQSEILNFERESVRGYVWFWNHRVYFEVFNIIPVDSKNLEIDGYNFILNKFKEMFIDPLVEELKIKIDLSGPEKFLIDSIGENALGVLKAFSNGANKATGNIHPNDFVRWCDFVFVVFRREIELDTRELAYWLIDNGWSADMANKLVGEFSYSIKLLERYEQTC